MSEWVTLEKDTDCKGCHYTIRKKDPEGMYKTSDGYFCAEFCAREYEENKKETDNNPTTETR